MTGGTVVSAPSFSPALDAEFIGTGADYIHNDPSGKHMRLNAHGVIKYADSRSFTISSLPGQVAWKIFIIIPMKITQNLAKFLE